MTVLVVNSVCLGRLLLGMSWRSWAQSFRTRRRYQSLLTRLTSFAKITQRVMSAAHTRTRHLGVCFSFSRQEKGAKQKKLKRVTKRPHFNKQMTSFEDCASTEDKPTWKVTQKETTRPRKDTKSDHKRKAKRLFVSTRIKHRLHLTIKEQTILFTTLQPQT